MQETTEVLFLEFEMRPRLPQAEITGGPLDSGCAGDSSASRAAAVREGAG